jgi:hypothetical protein
LRSCWRRKSDAKRSVLAVESLHYGTTPVRASLHGTSMPSNERGIEPCPESKC